MKRLGSILLVAGCLSGTLQPYAQEYPAGPLYDTPDELSFKARAAARTLLFKELEPLSLQWLREEANPLLRARRKLRQAIQTRAEKAATTAVPMVPKRDLSKEVGLWRMSVGNTSADNWSPYPDRALDARVYHITAYCISFFFLQIKPFYTDVFYLHSLWSYLHKLWS